MSEREMDRPAIPGAEAFSEVQVNTTVPIFRGDSDSDGAESAESNYNMSKRPSIEITAPHIDGGHTFLLTISETVISTTETTTITSSGEKMAEEKIKENMVEKNKNEEKMDCEKDICVLEDPHIRTPSETASSAGEDEVDKSVVPLSTSLPSKLLRLHARRSAQALLERVGSESEDVGDNIHPVAAEGACALPMMGVPTAPPHPGPSGRERRDMEEDRNIDCGVGSSIEGSEESEEDDELKPLAVDNHARMHEVALGSPPLDSSAGGGVVAASVLSEANLEKFHKHHHHSHHHHHHHQEQPQSQQYCNQQQQPQSNQRPALDIYLHPNFQFEIAKGAPIEDNSNSNYHSNTNPNSHSNMLECSPPPAVAPANSPVEQRRIHRSFLTMAKKSLDEAANDSAHSVATTEPDSEVATGENGGELINEIDTLDPALIPSEELATEIAAAVEFYFSNESILKDAFLLKHVRRNKEGFVSLKLVSSFKRVRQLTKEWKVVGNAVRRKSQSIELNEIGTKVRRIESLPSFDETMPSRTIVACDLPMDKLTIEKVSDIFNKCGEIALIRILKPGMAIPVDVRQFMNKYPEMMQKECALIEYLESTSARDARQLPGPFTVYEMVAPKKKTGKKATPSTPPIIPVAAPVANMVENYRYYNDATYERTRGGSFSGIVPHMDSMDLRLKLKRNNSDFNPRAAHTAYADMQHQQHQQYHQQHHQQQHHQQHHHQQHHHRVDRAERDYPDRYQAVPQQQQQQQHYSQQHHYQQQQPHQQHHNANHRGSIDHEHSHQFQNYQPRGSIGSQHEAVASIANSNSNSSSNNNMQFHAYSPRRYSNTSTLSTQTPVGSLNDSGKLFGINSKIQSTPRESISGSATNIRRISNCSDGYGPYSESSRRPSNCSETNAPQRRDSNCSESCSCSRRVSDFEVVAPEAYRKISQGSIGSGGGGGSGLGERRFSNGSMQFERTFSNDSDGNGHTFTRRLSNSDFNAPSDRRQSLETQTSVPYDDPNVGGGGGGYMVFPRRCSNGQFNNPASKLAAYDNAQYINGRRISTDSGYDRRYSFGSEYEGSPRSRTGSFINNYKNGMDMDGQPRSRTGSFLDGSPRSRSGSFAQRAAENLVRTPIGPDGSKGFGTRARKFGQSVSPVN